MFKKFAAPSTVSYRLESKIRKISNMDMVDTDSCHCLGLGCNFCTMTMMRTERQALHALCAVAQNCGEFTHYDIEGKKFKMSQAQALRDTELFCRLWLESHDEEPLQERKEAVKDRMARLDAAVKSFLESDAIEADEKGRVVNSVFASAFRQHTGIRATQQSISQAARRNGIKAHSSHATRFLLGIRLKLTVPPT